MGDYAIAWGPKSEDSLNDLTKAWTDVATLTRSESRKDANTEAQVAITNLASVSGVEMVKDWGLDWDPGSTPQNTGAGAYFCAFVNNLGLKTLGDIMRSSASTLSVGGKNAAVLIVRIMNEIIKKAFNIIGVHSTGGDYYYIFTNAVQGPSMPASFFEEHSSSDDQSKDLVKGVPLWSCSPQTYSYTSGEGGITLINAPIENIVPALGTCTNEPSDLAVPWIESARDIINTVTELHNKDGTALNAAWEQSIQPLITALDSRLVAVVKIGDSELPCIIQAKVIARVAVAMAPHLDGMKDALARVVSDSDSIDEDEVITHLENTLAILSQMYADQEHQASPADKDIPRVEKLLARVFGTGPPGYVALAVALDKYVGALSPSMQIIYRLIGRLTNAISRELPTGGAAKGGGQYNDHSPSKEASDVFHDVQPATRQAFVHEQHTAFEQALVMAPLTSQVDIMVVNGNIARAWKERDVNVDGLKKASKAFECDRLGAGAAAPGTAATAAASAAASTAAASASAAAAASTASTASTSTLGLANTAGSSTPFIAALEQDVSMGLARFGDVVSDWEGMIAPPPSNSQGSNASDGDDDDWTLKTRSRYSLSPSPQPGATPKEGMNGGGRLITRVLPGSKRTRKCKQRSKSRTLKQKRT
jgi:hypothetical protein